MNREADERDEIEIVFRKYDPDWEQPFGIRANPPNSNPDKDDGFDGFNWRTALWSLFVPWHADWLVTWIYLGFALYFWIETFMMLD